MSLGQDRLVAMKPDAVLQILNPDTAQIAFSNHTVTFSGVPIVRSLEVLVPSLSTPRQPSKLISDVATTTDLDESVITLAVELLINSKCLFETDGTSHVRTGVRPFLASLGLDPTVLVGAGQVSPLAVCPTESRESLRELLQRSEICAEIVSFSQGDQRTSIGERLGEIIAPNSAEDRLILCWGYPYKSALPRMINQFAAARRLSALYGFCDTSVGRVGPWVFPGNGSCLECLLRRFMANGGPNEVLADEHYRRATASYLPAAPISHPAFEMSVAAAFVLEATKIIWRLQPSTLGSFWEHNIFSPRVTKRVVLRVPKCGVCRSDMPPRLPWDVVYPELSALDGREMSVALNPGEQDDG